MSELPKGWEIAEINEVLASQHDGKLIHQGWSPQCEKDTCDSPSQWGVLKTTAIQAADFQWQHHKKLPSPLEPRVGIEVAVGDLLLTCAGPRVRCGVACLVRTVRPKLMLSGKMYRFRANPKVIDERYLEAFLQTQEAQLQIDAMKTGGSDSGLNLTHERFRKLRVSVAPRAEQTRIVAKLEELLSDLDAGVAEIKAAQKKLTQYRQSLLKAAVEGTLTAEWRAKNTPSEAGAQLLERILTERRARWEAKQLAKFKEQGKTPPKDWQKKYPEPVQPDNTGLPELPEGWVWSSLGQCFHVAVGATPSRKEPSYWGGSIPWVSSGEVRFSRITITKEMITQDGLNNSSTQLNPVGSVLLGMIGEGKTRGQVAILDVEAANNQNCAAIWANKAGVPSEYVYFWLWSQYEQTRRGSSGNNQPALNKSIVERILFPLAPLGEMNEIVRLVSQALDAISEQELAIEISLKQSTAQRQNILRAAFSGQLVPQDPNDEPASVLLERIRAERQNTRTHSRKKTAVARPSKETRC